MKIIGLTGGSGTGKGTVAARMRALGAGVPHALCGEPRNAVRARYRLRRRNRRERRT